ncbi:hypothetical protein [Poriferisphaera sp. WC338]
MTLPKKIKQRLSLVIDTDTFNEIDDQFALTYAFANQDIFDIKAVNAIL